MHRIRFLVCLMLISAVTAGQVDLNNGLVAYYPLKNNEIKNTASDKDVPALNCDNWLRIPNYNTLDYVSIGDLDITGNQITVEACFNADTNYFIPSTISYDLVSKHTSPADCNYLLRPVTAEISTTNGFYQIIACDYKPKKINHVALVYDGTTLKFYRNGYLMGSRPATGNLVTNNLITKIGNYAAGTLNGSLKGYINEVRIWNVARSHAQISAFMNSSLPSPASQPGLVAYYVFDNLQNKQGNALWNGQLNGAATINALNPQCGFLADSCDSQVQAGTCNGSLGDPVVNITFGNGTGNPGPALSAAVPGASTNYNYAGYATGNPPAVIFDGDYALVTGVPVNGAWFTGARDHTGDPGGYMAFFNAAPTPGEFYRQTVSGLCPGTTYEFAAWVANVLRASAIPGAILPNITFRLLNPANQQELASYSTGNISMSNTMTWQQYSFLFTLPPGSSSVTLVLANNNIGGSAQPGNDLAIDDITFRPCGPLTRASFSNGIPLDSSTIQCSDINLFGTVSGGLTSPAYQWQISTDGGIQFTNISGATSLTATLSNLSPGNYIFRLLTAEAGNIGSANCRFTSNRIRLTVTGCNQVNNGISGIVNEYTPVLRADVCRNSLDVEDATAFKAGDTVLIIQMKGAVIDSANTTAFGTVTDYRYAGNYEYNYVHTVTGNAITLSRLLLNNYNFSDGRVQLVRVPYFRSAIITDTLTCLPWDGRKGGVLALNVEDTLTLSQPIDVSGKGFRGGQIINTAQNITDCDYTGYAYDFSGIHAAPKGESIAEISLQISNGRGRLAAGGGGGNGHNSGGGGGGHGGDGGTGGYQYEACNQGIDNRGIGGNALPYTMLSNRVFAGGGGGAGHCNNQLFNPSALLNFSGGNGGGIILLSSRVIAGNNQIIRSNGAEPFSTTLNGPEAHDARGGGGAGGSILLNSSSLISPFVLECKGAKGGDLNTPALYRKVGPGGGGAGGVSWINQSSRPAGITLNINGGSGGRVLYDNSNYGTSPGLNGLELFNLVLPVASITFVPAIDTVTIRDSAENCNTLTFRGNALMNRDTVVSWFWDFGDHSTASGSVVTHSYLLPGNYRIKLVVTDSKGCIDSAFRYITIDNCPAAAPNIINSYAAVESINPCTNSILLDNASAFYAGDTILLIQMKGASINNSNSNAFGTVNSYNDAGLSEINYVDVINGNTVLLKNKLLRNYDAVNGAVQMIRVPFFLNSASRIPSPAFPGMAEKEVW